MPDGGNQLNEILDLEEESLVEQFTDLANGDDIPPLTEYFKGGNYDDSL